MKIINLYLNPEHRSKPGSYIPIIVVVAGLCLVLAALTGYDVLTLYKQSRLYQITVKKVQPQLDRIARIAQLREQYSQLAPIAPSAGNPFALIQALKSPDIYLQSLSLRDQKVTIELYYPINGSLHQIIKKLENVPCVKEVDLIAIRQHTKEQRALTLLVTLQ